jgi:hypothetical protein
MCRKKLSVIQTRRGRQRRKMLSVTRYITRWNGLGASGTSANELKSEYEKNY